MSSANYWWWRSRLSGDARRATVAHLDGMTNSEPTDAVLQHVAVLAFLDYPGIEVDDPTYSLSDDIE